MESSFTRVNGNQGNVVRDPATARGWPASAAPRSRGRLTKAEPPGGPATHAEQFPRSCGRFSSGRQSTPGSGSTRWLALVARCHRAVDSPVEHGINAPPTLAARLPECRNRTPAPSAAAVDGLRLGRLAVQRGADGRGGGRQYGNARAPGRVAGRQPQAGGGAIKARYSAERLRSASRRSARRCCRRSAASRRSSTR
jgi:hypothetical protein